MSGDICSYSNQSITFSIFNFLITKDIEVSLVVVDIAILVPEPLADHVTNQYGELWSALFNICRKALGHLMKFTQRSIPYRFELAG